MQTYLKSLFNIGQLIAVTVLLVASYGYGQTPTPILTPLVSSPADLLRFDAGRAGDGDDSVIGHPDFGWKKNWVETPEWGGRIGYLDANGTLRARMNRDENSPWVVVAHNVRDFQLMDWRLAVLKMDGRLLFAEGPLNTPLRLLEPGVVSYQMTLTRIGMLKADGTFLVKEQGFLPRKVASEVKAFQVLLDRVGVLKQDGSFLAHQGGHIHQLMPIANSVQNFQLEREWVALVRANKLTLANGDLDKLKFVEHAANVKDFEMEVTVELGEKPRSRLHLAVADLLGQVWVGEGDQPAFSLQTLPTPSARKVRWAGRQLVIHAEDGTVSFGMLHDENGSLANLRSAGFSRVFRANQEGALLLSRAAGRMSIQRTEVGGSMSAVNGLTRGGDTAQLADGATIRTDATEKVLLAQPATLPDIVKVEVSSMRPTHTRRPMGLGAGD